MAVDSIRYPTYPRLFCSCHTPKLHLLVKTIKLLPFCQSAVRFVRLHWLSHCWWYISNFSEMLWTSLIALPLFQVTWPIQQPGLNCSLHSENIWISSSRSHYKDMKHHTVQSSSIDEQVSKSWSNTAPIPTPEASIWSLSGWLKSWRLESELTACLRSLKADAEALGPSKPLSVLFTQCPRVQQCQQSFNRSRSTWSLYNSPTRQWEGMATISQSQPVMRDKLE